MKRIFATLLTLFFIISAEADSADERWKQVDKAMMKDHPAQALEILTGIKEDAKAGRLMKIFLDAGEREVLIKKQIDWKSAEKAEAEWRAELEDFGEPLLIYVHLNRERDKGALQYALDNKEALQSTHYNKELELLYLPYSFFETGSDYEDILWSNIRKAEAREAIRPFSDDVYPKNLLVELEAALSGPGDKCEESLGKIVSKYSDKPMRLLPEAELLSKRFMRMVADEDTPESDYRELLQDCKTHQQDPDLKAVVKTSGRGNVQGLIENLTSTRIHLKVKNDTLYAFGRNIRKAVIELDGKKQLKAKNDSEKLFVSDTLVFKLTGIPDGHHYFSCKKPWTSTTYDKYTVSLALRNENGQFAIYAADYLTGEPFRKVTVHVCEKPGQELVLNDGFTPLPESMQRLLKSKDSPSVWCSVPGDDGSERMSRKIIVGPAETAKGEEAGMQARILRDRGAYRPGDTLKFKVIAFDQDPHGQFVAVPEGTQLKANIYDSEKKQIVSKTMLTNGFGSASMVFPIPSGKRGGMFSIEIFNGRTSLARQEFRVDEFRLPTFDVLFNEADHQYKTNERFEICGRIKSYSAHPVKEARVSATLKKGKIIIPVVCSPDDDGHFSLPFSVSEKGLYTLTMTVTDSNGETHEFSKLVPIEQYINIKNEIVNASSSEADFVYSSDAVHVIESDTVVFNLKAHSCGQTILGDFAYRLLDHEGNCIREGTMPAGEDWPVDMSGLPDAVYSLYAYNPDAKSMDVETCFIKSTGRSGIIDGPVRSLFDPDNMTLASFEGQVWAIATLFSPSGSILESYPIYLDGRNGQDIADISFDYKDNYPDFVRMELFYFRDAGERCYTHIFKRTQRDLNIPFKFSRFRDMAGPREKCTWELSGIPACETAIAVFDASMDAIEALEWNRIFPAVPRMSDPAGNRLAGFISGKNLPKRAQSVVFGRVIDQNGDPIIAASILLQGSIIGTTSDVDGYFSLDVKPGSMLLFSCLGYVNQSMPAKDGMQVVLSEDTQLLDEVMIIGYGVKKTGIHIGGTSSHRAKPQPSKEENVETREVMTEALYFNPCLYPDENGRIPFGFSTSDKLSTFHVLAFAHNKEMQNASIRRDFTVTIPIKIQVHEPRYLYEGDSLVFSVSVSNNSWQAVEGNLHLYADLEDEAEDRMVPYSESVHLIIPGSSASSGTFNIGVPHAFLSSFVPRSQEPCMKLRLVFESDLFSDALRVKIPVRSDERRIVESHSALLAEGDSVDSVLDSLRKQFVNMPGSDAEMHVKALRELVNAGLEDLRSENSDDVLSLSSVYYADAILEKKTDSTTLKKILSCINTDGGFGWFRGMKSSPVVSAVLLDRFARLKTAGIAIPDLSACVHYIDSVQFNGYCLSPELYLYIRSQWACVPFAKGSKPTARLRSFSRRYLTPGRYDYAYGDVFRRALRTFTLKELCSSEDGLSLARSLGERMFTTPRFESSIKKDLEALRQYARPHPSGGLYYPNAVWPLRGLLTSEAYIHSLIAGLLPELSDGLLTWLLVQKENQAWQKDPSFTDALVMLKNAPDEILDRETVVLTAEKTIPFSKVRASGNGFTVSRRLLREDSSEVMPGDSLKLGEIVTAEYTVWSSENRSFVRLDAFREASFEPCEQLSGPFAFKAYGAYRNVRADRTEYWLDAWPEEQVILKERFFVTEEGIFQTPALEIESVYAPQYRATGSFAAPGVPNQRTPATF